MPQVPILTPTGQKSGTAQLPDQLFAAKINPQLIAQAVRVHLANQRQSPAQVKSRSQVKISGKKIWRQKGTGRARHGARSAPVFIGGGIAHGPTGKQHFKLRMSKKMNRAALASALTSKLKNRQVLIIKDLEKLQPKTKTAHQMLTKLKLNHQKISIILPDVINNLLLATRNLSQVTTTQANSLNTYTILNTGTLIFLPESIDVLKKTFIKTPSPSSPSTPSTSKTPTKKQSSPAKKAAPKPSLASTKKSSIISKPATPKQAKTKKTKPNK